MKMAEAEVGDGKEPVIRRYEFFQYTDAYDEENEPLLLFLHMDLLEPPTGELGAFIAANMVAANLAVVPEPSASQAILLGFAMLGKRQRRR